MLLSAVLCYYSLSIIKVKWEATLVLSHSGGTLAVFLDLSQFCFANNGNHYSRLSWKLNAKCMTSLSAAHNVVMAAP